MTKIKFEIAEKHILPLKIVGTALFAILLSWGVYAFNILMRSMFCFESGGDFPKFLLFFSCVILWGVCVALFLIYTGISEDL